MTTETYIKREEIKDVNATIRDLLNQLRERTEAENSQYEVHQVCMQLLPEEDGQHWKMFVYWDKRDGSYYFSYQDDDYEDTMFTRGYDLGAIMAKMVAEIIHVKDFEWIELV